MASRNGRDRCLPGASQNRFALVSRHVERRRRHLLTTRARAISGPTRTGPAHAIFADGPDRRGNRRAKKAICRTGSGVLVGAQCHGGWLFLTGHGHTGFVCFCSPGTRDPRRVRRRGENHYSVSARHQFAIPNSTILGHLLANDLNAAIADTVSRVLEWCAAIFFPQTLRNQRGRKRRSRL